MPASVRYCLSPGSLLAWLVLSTMASTVQAQIRAMPFSLPESMVNDSSGAQPASAGVVMLPATSPNGPSLDDEESFSALGVIPAAYQEPAVSATDQPAAEPITEAIPPTPATTPGACGCPTINRDGCPPYYVAPYTAPGDFYAMPSNTPSIGTASVWTWHLLPDSLLFKSYMAGGRESRFASQWVHERDMGWLWDATLGGRVGILRYGTPDGCRPEGWQIDIEGAAFPRLSFERDRDLVAADFRFGVPITTRQGPWETKLAYYHLSSHLGDEYMVTFPMATRINYVRDVLVAAVGFWALPDMRLYAETGYAFYTQGGSRPWEFQFGIDWASPEPTGPLGSPFFAVNGRLRQEIDYGGNFTCQTGWQWRGPTGHFMRFGMHYFNGQSDQAQFFRDHEEQIGLGLWYDY